MADGLTPGSCATSDATGGGRVVRGGAAEVEGGGTVVVGSGTDLSLVPWEFDVALLSAEGMNRQGLWNSQEGISSFQRHVCAKSRRAAFCLDHSKLGKSAPSFLLPWERVPHLITDTPSTQLHRAGIELAENRWTKV